MLEVQPIHPGEILHTEFMEPNHVSQNLLARVTGLSPRAVNQIVHGKRSITPRTAILLGRAFGTSAEFWMNLQAHYDLVTERDYLGSEADNVKRLA